MNKVVLMQGNEACVWGALYAGMNFYSGYPITPSTEIAELSARDLPKVGGVFMQMEDEIAGIATAIGASIAGKKAMTATSGPGFSLKQENFGYAAMAEVPLVVVNVQRGGPSTGLPTSPGQGDVMQSRYGSHGDVPVIVLSPNSVQEMLTLTIEAFNLAEEFVTPVTLLCDEVVGHMREKVVLPEVGEISVSNRKPPLEDREYMPYRVEEGDIVRRVPEYGSKNIYHITGLFHDETGFPSNSTENARKMIDHLHNKILHHKDRIVKVEKYIPEDAKVCVLAYGSTARSARGAIEMLKEEGINVGYFRPITIWPSAEDEIKELAKQMDTILVCELNLGQYKNEIERIAKSDAQVELIGHANGQIITPEEIVERVKELL